MGQNQEKLDGGEEVPGAVPEETSPDSETSPDPDSGSAGDVMEGGSSCEVGAANSGENRGELDARDPDGCSSQENTRLWVRPFAVSEVRQGGAAGMAGRGGAGGEGGEGGWASETDLRETEKNPKCSPELEETARAYKLHNQIRKVRESSEGGLHRSKAKMEGTERCSTREEIQDEHFSAAAHERCQHAFTSQDTEALANMDEDYASLKTSSSGAPAGRQVLSSVQQDESDAIMAGMAAGDVKLSSGTVGRLSKRKDPPTAQSLHPLKNSEKKEPLSDMSDTIHSRPANGTTGNTKEGTLACETNSNCSPTRPNTLDSRQAEETDDKIDLNSSTSLSLNSEPSSILEKLLMRNQKQIILSDISEADINETDSVDDGAQRTVDSAASQLACPATDKSAVNTLLSSWNKKKMDENQHEGKAADKDQDIKGQDVKEPDTSDSSPVLHFQTATENKCENSLTHPKSARDQSSKENESASTVTDLTLPANGDEHRVTAEKSNWKVVLRKKSEKENNSDRTGTVKTDVMQNTNVTQQMGNLGSDRPSENLVKRNEDITSGRDDSQDLPKSRPVSALIKETVQLHEKLLHQEWSKPADVKIDEQGQSVKVAQMKAAFDLVQRSPDKSLERKPSVRKGKAHILLFKYTLLPKEQMKFVVNSVQIHLLQVK